MAEPQIPAIFFSGLTTDQEKENLKMTLLSSRTAVRKVNDLVEMRKDSTAQAMISTELYDKPAWAYYQAHLNGKREAYDEIIRMTKWAL